MGDEYLDGKRAATLETIQESLDDLKRRLFGEYDDGEHGVVAGLDKRIRNLETWRAVVVGAVGVLGVFLGWLGRLIHQ